MLRLEQLSKRYGDHLVFENLTHTFAPGCFALCEEYSTGKSTLLNLIAGTLAPSAGDVLISEHSIASAPQQARTRVAVVPDDCLSFPTLTGRELLEQVATEKNAVIDASVLDLAYKLGLEPHLDKRFEQMSKGTRRKVYLAAAALGDPAVIVADGPTNGLDTPACSALAEQFKAWGQSRVVLFASHDPDFVQACEARSVTLQELKAA